ncbi:cellulose binding domain-containing protein [Actinomadura pelletieri DSM 43383]|uniref:Cellulose binding domain-containing protein n=1 Tax=Actinomadura pelletieri DSM 43383 TaxID=1120940 RepID=A0A495QQ28_9ACTN|nr:cellulose binding domain-containing protein [Actinomadura pelletieri]RKS75048.1 cellulose binding domain-containing protein [Actinomadura pelletieri DSM 43383]
MGRHTRRERPGRGPVPDRDATYGPFYDAPLDPTFDTYSGPTDDRVYVSPHDRASTGPPPDAEWTHGPPDEHLFDPLPGDYPGDYPGAPGSYSAFASDDPFDSSDFWSPETPEPENRPREKSGSKRPLKFLSMLPVPLLPIVALVIAVGIVAYALSTQQISLNFAGGAPSESTQNSPRDNPVSDRDDDDGERPSRSGEGRSDGLIVAFRVASKTPDGFKATATIANKGTRPITKWALAFRISGASVTAVKGATVVRKGKVAHVRGRTAIAPGAKVRIVFAAKGTASRPATCILNGQPCVMV